MTLEFVIGLGVFVCAMLDLWSDKWVTGLWQKFIVSAITGLGTVGAAHLIRIVVEGLSTMSGVGK